MDLDAANSGLDAVTLQDGRHVLVRNPLPSSGSARGQLTLSVSTDGMAWTDAVTLAHAERGEFSDPAVIQTEDGLVHVTYTHDRTTIHHAVLDPARLS